MNVNIVNRFQGEKAEQLQLAAVPDKRIVDRSSIPDFIISFYWG